MEYARAKAEFPVPSEISKFIGAGVNLSHSNAIDFGYRSISKEANETALFFADFINYAILLNLFESIDTLSREPHISGNGFRVDFSTKPKNNFVAALATDDVFQGTLKGCKNIENVRERMRKRLNAYRRFLHCNDRELDGQIRESKTDIGVPLSAAATLLKESGIIQQDVSIFIHIDQYEELANISSQEENSPDYRRIINRALARRDATISYRIGTRGHAWRNHGFIFGSKAKLEEERDYKYVDLDLMLRRDENEETWVFPDFAQDVFTRRLTHAGFRPDVGKDQSLLRHVFGKGLSAPDKAKKYGGSDSTRSVKVDPSWPENFKKGIIELAKEDPLSARLLEAWVLQKLDQHTNIKKSSSPLKPSMKMLLDMKKKAYWKKERIELALIQIAGRCQQRPLWSGDLEIIYLSGGNILTFLSICQFIWGVQNQLREQDGLSSDISEIKFDIQTIGIFKASNHWFNKITPETGKSDERLQLTRQIGKILGQKLYDDQKMSYPGHNGFSLADAELERFPDVKEILEEMCDYGTLIATSHTTKEKNRQSRRKFYLNPILCPRFKMPYKRLKEPYYIRPAIIQDWMRKIEPKLPRSRTKQADKRSMPLFDEGKDS